MGLVPGWKKMAKTKKKMRWGMQSAAPGMSLMWLFSSKFVEGSHRIVELADVCIA
jgi:hypothetical protein